MFREWLKDLWKEAWGRGLFLIGLGSNVITFFSPGLQSRVLRGIAILLLLGGFLWANFSVYKKLRARIADANKDIAKKDVALNERNFKIAMAAEGTPPVIKITATEVVSISRLGYLLSDETCIVSEALSLEGEAVEVPLNTTHLAAIFKIRRPDMSTWDGSGPMKFAITVNGKAHPYILPARIENVVGVGYKITGSSEFGKT